MGNDALARALRSASPQAAPLVQRSQYLADALRALQESGDKIGSNTELYGKLAATAINQFSKSRTDKRLKEVDSIERSNRAGRALADLTGEAFTPQAIPEDQGLLARLLRREPAPTPAPTPAPQPAPVAPQPQPQPPAAPPQMMGAPNIDQAGPIPDVSFGPTPAGPNYPLGIRNNNPGNLRDTPTPWQGATGAAGGFEVFDTPESGIRAMARNLNTYGKRGINTLEGIISTWAPPSENPTGNYVAAMSKALGVDPRQPLDLNNPQVLEALSGAMIQFENGRNPYTPEQIGAGVQMALGGVRQPPPVQPPAPAEMPAGPMAPAGSLQPAGATPQPRRPAPEQLAFLQKLLTSPNADDQDMGMAYAKKLQEEMARPIEYDITVQDGQLIRVPKIAGQGAVSVERLPGTQSIPLTDPAERARYGIQAEDKRAWQLKPDGTLDLPDKSVNVSINQQADDKFASTLAEGQARAFNEMYAGGVEGKRSLSDVNQLRILSQQVGPGGFEGAVKGWLANNGLLGADGDAARAFTAFVNRLAPKQRVEGSGAQSNLEFEAFLRALPRLVNTPEGNRILLDTSEALARDQITRGDIAASVLDGDRTRKEANALLRRLPDPMTAFAQYRKAQGGNAPGAVQGGRTPGGFTPPQTQTAKLLQSSGRLDPKAPLGALPNPYVPRSKADYDRIPRGATYIDDDGTIKRKGGQ